MFGVKFGSVALPCNPQCFPLVYVACPTSPLSSPALSPSPHGNQIGPAPVDLSAPPLFLTPLCCQRAQCFCLPCRWFSQEILSFYVQLDTHQLPIETSQLCADHRAVPSDSEPVVRVKWNFGSFF
ncbi:unnamed protein product [Coregonus sp. 'balchen']|nr:unnamed protein product [Coregonus sp. 'balchen']